MDELVAFLALCEAAEVTAKPSTCRHDNRDRPVDFSCNAKSDCAYNQEHVRECILNGVHVNRIKPRVSREAEDLDKADTHLHNATIDGDCEKSDGTFDGEFFRRSCRRLSENVLAQVAHDYDKADDDRQNGLEEFVANADQEAGSEERTEKCRQQELQKDFLVQVAVTRKIIGAAKVPDDEPDAVRAVCDSRGEPEENHDGEASVEPPPAMLLMRLTTAPKIKNAGYWA